MTKQRGRHISDRKFQERYEERRRRHETQKNARQAELDAVFGRMARGDLIRGGHYGQRSCNRTNRPNTWLHRPATRREDSPCQLGAVHTWRDADLPMSAIGSLLGAKRTMTLWSLAY